MTGNNIKNCVEFQCNFSDGVGRTGTFIAVDYMLQQGPTQRFMTIPKLVYEFRRQRINMVQTLVTQDSFI